MQTTIEAKLLDKLINYRFLSSFVIFSVNIETFFILCKWTLINFYLFIALNIITFVESKKEKKIYK